MPYAAQLMTFMRASKHPPQVCCLYAGTRGQPAHETPEGGKFTTEFLKADHKKTPRQLVKDMKMPPNQTPGCLLNLIGEDVSMETLLARVQHVVIIAPDYAGAEAIPGVAADAKNMEEFFWGYSNPDMTKHVGRGAMGVGQIKVDLTAAATRNNHVAVYVACHSENVPGLDKSEVDGKDQCLKINGRFIRDHEFWSCIIGQYAGAKRSVLVILDTCYAGGFVDAGDLPFVAKPPAPAQPAPPAAQPVRFKKIRAALAKDPPTAADFAQNCVASMSSGSWPSQVLSMFLCVFLAWGLLRVGSKKETRTRGAVAIGVPVIMYFGVFRFISFFFDLSRVAAEAQIAMAASATIVSLAMGAYHGINRLVHARSFEWKEETFTRAIRFSKVAFEFNALMLSVALCQSGSTMSVAVRGSNLTIHKFPLRMKGGEPVCDLPIIDSDEYVVAAFAESNYTVVGPNLIATCSHEMFVAAVKSRLQGDMSRIERLQVDNVTWNVAEFNEQAHAFMVPSSWDARADHVTRVNGMITQLAPGGVYGALRKDLVLAPDDSVYGWTRAAAIILWKGLTGALRSMLRA